MSRYFKTFILLFAASLILPATVSAKVTPAHKYQQGKFTGDHKQENKSGEEPEVQCEAVGYYSAKITNATCTDVKVGKKTCYKCSCPPEYEFSCTSAGFISPDLITKFEGTLASSSQLRSASLSGAAASSSLGSSVGSQFEQFDPSTPSIEKYSGSGCTIGKNTLYKTCNCAAGYISEDSLHSSFSSEFSGNPVTLRGPNTGKTITCYQDTFSCKNGRFKVSKGEISNLNTSSSTFTINDDNKFITYKGQSLLKNLSASNNLFCVTGATISSPLYSSRPANTDCAKFVDNQSAKYYPSVKYGYFKNECSTNAYCVGSDAGSDCVVYSGDPVKTFDGVNDGAITCRASVGCNTGIVTNKTTGETSFCASVDVGIGFAKNEYTITTPSSSTQQKCYKLACNTSNSWQQAYIGATKAVTEYQADPDSASTHYSYDVKSATSGSNILICRRPNGCHVSTTDSTKWYNFSPVPTTHSDLNPNYYANEVCWGGWLALWRKNDVCK